MLLLITFTDIMYNVDCERVMCGVCCRGNKPKAGLFFTNV